MSSFNVEEFRRNPDDTNCALGRDGGNLPGGCFAVLPRAQCGRADYSLAPAVTSPVS